MGVGRRTQGELMQDEEVTSSPRSVEEEVFGHETDFRSEESVSEDDGNVSPRNEAKRWRRKQRRKESRNQDLSPRSSFHVDWTKPMRRSTMAIKKAYKGLHHKFAEFGHVPAEKQLQAVEHLRFLLASEGLLRIDYDEYALHRFLRARQFHVDRAMEMIKKNIQWREENEVEKIVSSFHFEEEEEFLQVYPQGYYKTDKQGRPIYYQKLGGVTWKKLTAVTSVERYLKYHIREYEKLVRYKFPACSAHAGRHVDQTLTILDLRDVIVSQFNSDARHLLKIIAAIDSDNYPEMMGRMIIINAPTSFKMVYAVVKTFIDKRTASKIEIYGSRYEKRLLELVDINNLPKELGGVSVEGLLSNPGPWEGTMPRTRSDVTIASSMTKVGSSMDRMATVPAFPERKMSLSEEEEAEEAAVERSLLDRMEEMEETVAESFKKLRSSVEELSKKKKSGKVEPHEWLAPQGSLFDRIQKLEEHVRLIREVQDRIEQRAAGQANLRRWICFSSP